jgi:hypothetical protein
MKFYLLLLVGISAADIDTTSQSQIPLTLHITKEFLTWNNGPNPTWNNSEFQWVVLESGCSERGEPCKTQKPRKVSYDLPTWWADITLNASDVYQISLCETAKCDSGKHGRIANFNHATLYFVEVSSEVHNQMFQFPPNKAPWYSKLDFGSGDTVAETVANNDGQILSSTCKPAASCPAGQNEVISKLAIPKEINLYVGLKPEQHNDPSLTLVI